MDCQSRLTARFLRSQETIHRAEAFWLLLFLGIYKEETRFLADNEPVDKKRLKIAYFKEVIDLNDYQDEEFNEEEQEQKALMEVEESMGRFFQYQGDKEDWRGLVGYFQVLEDMNCCAPTNTVLFAFCVDHKRLVMRAEEFVKFYSQCHIV